MGKTIVSYNRKVKIYVTYTIYKLPNKTISIVPFHNSQTVYIVLLCGDFNIDLLQIHTIPFYNDFVETADSIYWISFHDNFTNKNC